MRRTIDIHTHLHPPKLFAAIRRWFAEKSPWDLSHNPSEPADIAAALRRAGVERFVFCSYAHKPGIARGLNAWLAATSRTLGGYGLPLATVHLDDPAYVDDARVAFADGCIGLKLHEDVQGLAADDPRFAPVWDELGASGGFLLVHVGPIPWHYASGPGVARIGRVLERHPDLRVVVAHYGTPDTRAYFDMMKRHRNLYLDTTMVFAAESPMRADAHAALIAAYPERVLYGSDFPNIPYAYASERIGIEALGLPEDVLEAVFRGNAARLIAHATQMTGKM